MTARTDKAELLRAGWACLIAGVLLGLAARSGAASEPSVQGIRLRAMDVIIGPPGEPINTRVQVLNAQGKFVGFIGDWGTKEGQLFRPKGVVAERDRVFVTDSYLGRVQGFDLRGRFLGCLAGPNGAPVELTTPTGMAVDASRRRLYVVELKANRVFRLDLE